MSKIAQPYQIGPLTISNRIIVAPMCMYSAKNGVPGPFHAQHLGRLALSGAGLAIMEATAVSEEGRISDRCLGLWNDEQEAAFASLLSATRSYCQTPIGIQIGHAGRKASTSALWINGGKPLSRQDGAWPVLGPTDAPFSEGWPVPHAITDSDMDGLVSGFENCARRADKVGFDALELHAAHGYLLSSFLSPVANTRSDEYGGSLENRMRFPLRVAQAVRNVWPNSKALGARLNGSDWSEHGITPEEAAIFGQQLSAVGYDWLHISSGGNDPMAKISAQSAYQIPFAQTVKSKNPDTTVIAVGLIKDAEAAAEVIDNHSADLVAVGRAVLDNPNWPHHALADLTGHADLPHQYERASLVWRKRAP